MIWAMNPPVIGISFRPWKRAGKPARFMQDRAYVEAIERAGAVALAITPMPPENARVLYGLCDGICLPGGHDVDPGRYGRTAITSAETESQPQLDELEITLVRWAREDRIPVLGICRGAQILNVALGGTLWQDLPREAAAFVHDGKPSWHEVRLAPGRLLAMHGTEVLTVNSRHHQSVRDLGAGLIPTAYSSDGVIEGVESTGEWFAVGVQWHPEDMAGSRHGEIPFSALARAAREKAAVC